MADLSEKEVIKKIRDGQIEYFSILVNKYTPIVTSYVKQRIKDEADTQDIIQNSFVKMYKAIGRLDPQQEFYPYFFSIVKNEIVEFYRKKKQSLPLFEDSVIQENPTHENSLEVKLLLEDLQEEQKGVLKMYYVEGYSYKDIAHKIKRPLNTVKTLIRRAKMEVRKKHDIT